MSEIDDGRVNAAPMEKITKLNSLNFTNNPVKKRTNALDGPKYNQHDRVHTDRTKNAKEPNDREPSAEYWFGMVYIR